LGYTYFGSEGGEVLVVVIFESLHFIYTLSLIAPRSAYGDVLAIKGALYEIVVVLGTVDNLVRSVKVYGD